MFCYESLVFIIYMNLILFMILYRNLSGMLLEELLNSCFCLGVYGKYLKF